VGEDALVLLTWIAEVADERLTLEPGDRRVEWETNTWWLGAADEDKKSLSAAAVVAAFERTAAAIGERIRELGFPGAATFHVWHDEQAGQLRCSTGSVPPDALPFTSAYTASDDLAPLVEAFLAGGEPEITPLRVWSSSVGGSDQADEDEEEFCRSFVAAGEPVAVGEPGVGPFDAPSVAAQETSRCKACSDGESGSAA
jgi:hypothetical protein